MGVPKIGLMMIVAGDADPVVNCILSQNGLMDCGVIAVDSKPESDFLYSALMSMHLPNVLIYRHEWQDSFAQARNDVLEKLLTNFKDISYAYWVDGDDVWDSSDIWDLPTDFQFLKKKLEEEQPDGVNILYKYSSSFQLYRNRFWKVTNGEVPFYWKGRCHEVEVSKMDSPIISNWPEFKLIHTKPQTGILDSKKHQKNIDLLLKAIAEDPYDPRNYYYLGQELYDNQEYEAAVEALKEAVKGEVAVAQKYQAMLMLVNALIKLEFYYSAETYLREAIDIYPDSPFAYTLMGDIKRIKKDWEDSIYWYKKALDAPGAPVIFDNIYQRTIAPLRWISVAYEKMGIREKAKEYHSLAGKCEVQDGLQSKNDVWLVDNAYLEKEVPEHFLACESTISDDYFVFENFNSSKVKTNLMGLLDYNPKMKIVRIINEGLDSAAAVVFKAREDFTNLPDNEKEMLHNSLYKELPGHEQFSLYEDFYNFWIENAVSDCLDGTGGDLNILELGTNIGLSARMFKERIKYLAPALPFKFSMCDTNLTKEAWAIIDDKEMFFIHDAAENVIHSLKNESLDIIHMDLAPHTYEQAVDIFNLYARKLKPWGVMIWHDVGVSKNFNFGGRKFLDKLRYPWCVTYCKEKPEASDLAPATIWRVF